MVKIRNDRPAPSPARAPNPRRRSLAEARRPRVTRAGWAFIAAVAVSAVLWALVIWIALLTVSHGGVPLR